MRIFRHENDVPVDLRGSAVAVGNFDGVHRGHQAVIGEAGRIAAAEGLPWAVLTFEPHPRQLFQPDIDAFRLTPLRAKAHRIAALGVEALVVLTFDRPFSLRSAEDFVDGVLVGGLDARHVISGYDFVFGHRREGTTESLLRLGSERGFGFTCVPAVHDADGNPISSTRIRAALRRGDPAEAAVQLGRRFEIEGRVQHGDRRGRTLGFPTANIVLGETLRPALGVYAVRVAIDEDGPDVHKGVANIGRRPTFDGGQTVVLEVHLFDFADDLYGRHLRVALVEYLRPEKKFDGLDGLKAQIADDGAQARAILAQP